MTDSVAGRLVTVFGGSGFLGRHLAQALCARGARLRIAVRRPSLAGDLRLAGEVGQIQIVAANVGHPASVSRALQGADAVVNLVGILIQSGAQTFEAIQGKGAGNVAHAARAAGIDHVVHVSAIGADKASASAYARSKARGEKMVREQCPDAVILRPSLIFGPEDDFFNRFAAMARLSPFLPLIGGGVTRFQPVYVGDVAEAICAALEMPSARGKLFALGGPSVYRFSELLRLILTEIDRRRILVSIPFGPAEFIGKILDAVFGCIPFAAPPLTGDQVRLLRTDTVVDAAMAGIDSLVQRPLRSVEVTIPAYLWRYRAHGEFHRLQADQEGSGDSTNSNAPSTSR